MELPFKSFPFLDSVIEQPMFMVMWAAFGAPLLMLVLTIPVRLYKNLSIATRLNTIIFTSIGFTWILGFVLMIMFFFMGISGIKLYFIWIVLYLSSIVFTAFNNKTIIKLFDEFSEKKLKH